MTDLVLRHKIERILIEFSGAKHLTILELTPRVCRWPLGDGPFTFCGHAAEPSKVYCEAHCVIAYRAFAQPRSRRVA